MNLREQIREITERRVNKAFAEHVSFPMLITSLAAKAFGEQWSEADVDTRALRKAYNLLSDTPFAVSDDEPEVE